MISIHVTRLLHYLAVPVASAGPQLDKTLRTFVLDTCTASLTFMTEYGVR